MARNCLTGAVSASPFIDLSTWNTTLFRAIHPVLLPDGTIVVKDHYSPLFGVDFCGHRTWMNDKKVFHHSTELDADRFLWIPSLVEPQSVKGVPRDFAEDEVVKLNTKGEVVFSRSVTTLMLDHGLEYLLFTNGSYVFDPTHLNDIEPVREDGPFWKRGDVFLSLRNISTIMLYRPSTDEIIWMKQGPWVAQHDVDVLDDRRISVYDNHAEDRGDGAFVEDSSNVVIYDFATDAISRPFADLMKSEKIKTMYAGLSTQLPDGYTIIEDVTDARLILASPAGKVAAEFVNRAENGKIHQLGWTSYVDQSLGDRVLAAAKGVDCGG